MGRINRSELIDETQVGIYHCINRCVRRAWLCGEDPLTGQSFDHRKQWMQERMQFLAGCFALDLLAFAIMSNHLHVILRNRPDVVSSWSNREVALRWLRLFPDRRAPDDQPAEPSDEELQARCDDEDWIVERRRRLSSISWFMRCLCEPIARQANYEDQCSGRFWEGRFRSQPLLDEAAVMACAVYVDLNPVKARLAETPETARFTSIYERIQARDDHDSSANSDVEPFTGSADSASQPSDWLSPVELKPDESQSKTSTSSRASNRGFLPMSNDAYIRLVEWTAAELTSSAAGSMVPVDVALALDTISTDAVTFVEWVNRFNHLTRRAAGDESSLAREAARCGRRWLQRSQAHRRLFG